TSRSRRLRRGERQIAHRRGDALVQDIEPVVVPQEFCTLHEAVAAKAEGVAAKFVDLETALVAVAGGRIGAVALAHDLDFVNGAAKLDPHRQRKRRGQRAPTPPWRRM